MITLKPGCLVQMKPGFARSLYSYNNRGDLPFDRGDENTRLMYKITHLSPPIMFVTKKYSHNPILPSIEFWEYVFLHKGKLWWTGVNPDNKPLESLMVVIGQNGER